MWRSHYQRYEMTFDMRNAAPQPPGGLQIDIADERQVRWWCAELNCSDDELRAALEALSVNPPVSKDKLLEFIRAARAKLDAVKRVADLNEMQRSGNQPKATPPTPRRSPGPR